MIPTQAQIDRWENFKGVAHRADLEIRAMMLRYKQLKTTYAFKTAHNLPIGFDPGAMATESKAIWSLNERLKGAIGQVELEKFGLHFRGGEIDIMAPPGTPDDQIEPYTLQGWPIIIIGAVVAYAVIEVVADLRQRNYDMYRKATNLVKHADEQLCADPASQQCRNWTQKKDDNNFEEQNGTIFSLFDEAEKWPAKVKSFGVGLGTGVLIAVGVGLFLWARQQRGGK